MDDNANEVGVVVHPPKFFFDAVVFARLRRQGMYIGTGFHKAFDFAKALHSRYIYLRDGGPV